MTRAMGRTFGSINVDSGWGTNLYDVSLGDPMTLVKHNNEGLGGKGLPVTLRVPVDADNGMVVDSVVVLVNGAQADQFYQWRAPQFRKQHNAPGDNEGATARNHHEWELRGEGHTGPGGGRVGSSASGVAGMFGLLRGHELNQPGYPIQHALQIVLSRGKKECGMILKGVDVWPASGVDGGCRQPGACTGEVPYGALLAIPPNANPEQFGLSEPGKRLATALRDYGTYAVDAGSCPSMRGDQYISRAIAQQLREDMRKIYPHLRVVLNNEKDQQASGGGEARAPNCAFDAQ